MAKHIVKYKVFLDSNTLRDKDWVKTDFFERIDKLRQEKLADVAFYLPGIVAQEWQNHYRKLAAQHQASAVRFSEKLEEMGVSIRLPKKLEEADFDRIATRHLSKHQLFVIDTPYEKIDWPALMERAVRHLPPFEPDSDKGIKDAVLAHTVMEYAENHARQKNWRLVVITNDNRLQTYLLEMVDGERTDVYSTLEDFTSNLRLKVDELGADLLAKAKQAFFTPREPESLYKKEKIYSRIREQYSALISLEGSPRLHILTLAPKKLKGDLPIPNDDEWVPMDDKTSIVETSFTGRSGGRLRWSTRINHKQAYALSTLSKPDDTVINNPASVIHTVGLVVNWSARLSSTGSITSMKVISIRPVDESVEVNPLAAIDYETGITSLTRRNTAEAGSYLQSVLEGLRALGADTSTIFSAARNAVGGSHTIDTVLRASEPSNQQSTGESVKGSKEKKS